MVHLLSLLAIGSLNAAVVLAGVSKSDPLKPKFSGHWVGTWVTMPQLTEPANLPSAPFNGTSLKFANSTIRQTVHITIPGEQIRIRFSNAFSDVNLPITSATIALPQGGVSGTGAIIPSTLQHLTFSGSPSFSIPNGAQVVSDPLDFNLEANSTLTVTLYTAAGQASESITSHPGSRATSHFGLGDQTTATNITEQGNAAHWYFLSAVETWSKENTNAIAIVGDSLTDGRGSTTDGNDRWTDQLWYRLYPSRKSTPTVAVLNQAAGGNRILADGLGPNGLGRIDRDVLAQSGVKWVIIWEGTNDIGTADATAAAQQAVESQLIAAFNQIITRVRSAGLPIYGATITPFCGPDQVYCDAAGLRDATRQRVNKWIKTSGRFDAVFDFDATVRNPHNITELDPSIDVGDHLHMIPAGYHRLAASIPLKLFNPSLTPAGHGFY